MMRILTLTMVVHGAAAGVLWEDVCTQADVKSSKWCDVSAPAKARAAAFVAALKPEEKVPIMTNEAQGVELAMGRRAIQTPRSVLHS